jgi:hypothetical protein
LFPVGGILHFFLEHLPDYRYASRRCLTRMTRIILFWSSIS